MSVRVWPEICVAMETLAQIYARVNDEGILTEEDKENIFVDIKDCLKIQARFSGFFHVFTSPEGSLKPWGENDYYEYFKTVDSFSRINDSSIYKLDVKHLLKDITNFKSQKNEVRKILREELITEGAYNGRFIAALGL